MDELTPRKRVSFKSLRMKPTLVKGEMQRANKEPLADRKTSANERPLKYPHIVLLSDPDGQ